MKFNALDGIERWEMRIVVSFGIDLDTWFEGFWDQVAEYFTHE